MKTTIKKKEKYKIIRVVINPYYYFMDTWLYLFYNLAWWGCGLDTNLWVKVYFIAKGHRFACAWDGRFDRLFCGSSGWPGLTPHIKIVRYLSSV